MEQISNEMPEDYMVWFKYIPIIILVGFSITILSDLGRGEITYSLLEIIGYLLIAGLFLLATFTGLKYVSGNHFSISKQALILGILDGFPMLQFLGLIYLNNAVDTPTIHFGLAGSIVIGIIALILIIAVSIWAKNGYYHHSSTFCAT